MTEQSPLSESHGRKRILLVEDDQLLLKSLQKFLALIGYEVVGVESVEAAIATFEGQTFDLLITDYHLTGLTGLDLARTLRTSGIRLPIILISAFVTDDVRASAKEFGIDSVLAKPMVLRTLDGIVANALASR